MRSDACPTCGHTRLIKTSRLPRWLRLRSCQEPIDDESGWPTGCPCDDPWHYAGT